MAQIADKKINGVDFTFQKCSPDSYLDNYDRFGRGKNTKRYMDWLFRNIIVKPTEIASKGLEYFEEKNDLGFATMVMDEIEDFLAKPDEHKASERTGPPKA